MSLFNGKFINDVNPNVIDLSGGGLYSIISFDPSMNNSITSNFKDFQQNGITTTMNNVVTMASKIVNSYIDTRSYKGIIAQSIYLQKDQTLFEIKLAELYNLNNTVNALNVDVTQNKTSIRNLTADLNDMTTTITGLTSKVDENESNITNMNSSLTGLTSTVAQHTTDIDGLKANAGGSSGAFVESMPLKEHQDLFFQNINHKTKTCFGIWETESFKLEMIIGTNQDAISFLFSGTDAFGIFPELGSKCNANCTGYMSVQKEEPIFYFNEDTNKDIQFPAQITPILQVSGSQYTVSNAKVNVISTMKINNPNYQRIYGDVSTDSTGVIGDSSNNTCNTTIFADFMNTKLYPNIRREINIDPKPEITFVDPDNSTMTEVLIDGDEGYVDVLVKYDSVTDLDLSITPITKCKYCSQSKYVRATVNMGDKIDLKEQAIYPYRYSMVARNTSTFSHIYASGNSLIISTTSFPGSINTLNFASFSFTFRVYGELSYYFGNQQISFNNVTISKANDAAFYSEMGLSDTLSYETAYRSLPFVIPMEVQDAIFLMLVMVNQHGQMKFIKLLDGTWNGNVAPTDIIGNLSPSSIYGESPYSTIFSQPLILYKNTTLLQQVSWKPSTQTMLSTDYKYAVARNFNIGNLREFMISHPDNKRILFYSSTSSPKQYNIYGSFRGVIIDVAPNGLENITISSNPINVANNTTLNLDHISLKNNSLSNYFTNNKIFYNTLWSSTGADTLYNLGGANIADYKNAIWSNIGLTRSFILSCKTGEEYLYCCPCNTDITDLLNVVHSNTQLMKYANKFAKNLFIVMSLGKTILETPAITLNDDTLYQLYGITEQSPRTVKLRVLNLMIVQDGDMGQCIYILCAVIFTSSNSSSSFNQLIILCFNKITNTNLNTIVSQTSFTQLYSNTFTPISFNGDSAGTICPNINPESGVMWIKGKWYPILTEFKSLQTSFSSLYYFQVYGLSYSRCNLDQFDREFTFPCKLYSFIGSYSSSDRFAKLSGNIFSKTQFILGSKILIKNNYTRQVYDMGQTDLPLYFTPELIESNAFYTNDNEYGRYVFPNNRNTHLSSGKETVPDTYKYWLTKGYASIVYNTVDYKMIILDMIAKIEENNTNYLNIIHLRGKLIFNNCEKNDIVISNVRFRKDNVSATDSNNMNNYTYINENSIHPVKSIVISFQYITNQDITWTDCCPINHGYMIS